MEGLIMTLARLSDNVSPSFPSLFNRLFEGDMMDWSNSNFADNNSTLPAVNVRENQNEFIIEVAAPGMKKDDFNLDFDNGRLSISSELSEESKNDEGEKFTRREYYYRSFQRSFTVPQNIVDSDKIQAKYTDGILKVTLPKREEVKPKPTKQIKIS